MAAERTGYKSLKKRVITIVMVIIYILGFLFFAYPDFNSFKSSVEVKTKIKEFNEFVASAGSDNDATDSEKTQDGHNKAEMDNLLKKMREYNEEIYTNGQKNLKDPWSYQVSSFDLSEYGLTDDVAAVISIPSIDVKLPVYLGASDENMEKGAVHLSQTSLPIGGENTNSVIAAHRGYKGIPMFREIEEISLGDEITITNFWETLTYQVVDIQIIGANDSSEILIREGKDMLTLLTCHPYTSNTYRYVVYCERVLSDDNIENIRDNTENAGLVNNNTNEILSENEEKSEYQIIIKEDGEDIRQMAISQDGDVMKNEEWLRKAGYAMYLFVGIAIVISFRPSKKKK